MRWHLHCDSGDVSDCCSLFSRTSFRATRGVRNPNLNNYIVWPWLEFAQFVSLPLRMYGMYRMQLKSSVNKGHFLFMSRLNAILRPHSASSELRYVFPWPQARSESVVRASPQKSEIIVRPICSSLIWLKHGASALFLLGAGFYTYKIIIFVVSQSWRFYHCIHVRKEKLLNFRRVCVQNFTAAVSRRALQFAYEVSAQFCHSYTPEPLCSPRNKSTAL